MRMKTIVAVALSFLVAGVAFAQKDARAELGFKPEKLYQFNDLDSVNLFNGNLALTVPIGPRYPVGGDLSYQLTLVYNSKVWDYEEIVAEGHVYYMARPNVRSNAGLGWRLSLGRLNPRTATTSTYPMNGGAGWLYEAPSGAEYSFTQLGVLDPDLNAEVLHTHDATMRMVKVSDSERFIEMPNGEVHTFKKQNGDWKLWTIADRFNNAVFVTYVTDSQGRDTSWNISDTSGRALSVSLSHQSAMDDSADKGQAIAAVTVRAIGNLAATYTFGYTTIPVPHGCGHQPPPAEILSPTTPQDTSTHTYLPFLTSISQPDGTSFDFAYHGVATSCEQGALSQMTLPTKGTIQYWYQQYFLPLDRCVEPPWADRPPGVRQRTTPDGSWNYVQNVGPFVTVDNGPQTYPLGVPGPCGFRDDGTGRPYEIPPRRWSRTSVLSPPTPRQGVDRRIRSDHYFDIWTVSPGEDPLVPPYPIGARVGEQGVAGAPNASSSRLAPIGFIDGPVTTTDESVLITVGGKRRALVSRTFEDCSTDGTCNELSRSAFVLPTIAAGYTAPTFFMPRIQANTTVYDSIVWTNGVPASDSACGAPGCYIDEEGSDPDGIGHFRLTSQRSNFPDATPVDVLTSYVPWSDAMRANKYIAWVPERYTEVRRTEGTSTAVTQFCFDALGFLTRKRTLAGSTAGATDLLAVFTSNARGEVEKEQFYGGDFQSISGSTACDAAAPTSAPPQYEIHHEYTNGILRRSEYWNPGGSSGLGFTTLDLTIDPSTAVVTKSRDSAMVETSYNYDPIPARLKDVSSPGLAPVTYVYTPAGGGIWSRVEIVTAAGTDTLRKRVEYDGLGRLFRESTLMPGEKWSSVETVFDGLGRKKEVTVAIDTGTQPPGPGPLAGDRWRFEYDSAGRVTKTTAPDTSVTTVAYTGARKEVRASSVAAPNGSDQAVQVTQEYDNAGRLRAVTEPSGATTSTSFVGAPIKTAYQYNALGLLTEVRMADGSVQLPRTFEYDGRGFLLAETHPEAGRTVYGEYDARGHARTRMIGGDVNKKLSFIRDSAERLLTVSEPHPDVAGTTRILKQFVYPNEVIGQPENKVRGKVGSATRYNYPSYTPPPGLPLVLGPIAVQEDYCYCDVAGRLTKRLTKLSTTDAMGNTVPIRDLEQSVVYNSLSLVDTSSYPICLYCGYSTYQSFSDVKWDYDKGRVTSIKTVDGSGLETGRFVDDTEYWPSGALRLRVHSNSIGDEQTTDSTGRTTALKFGVPTQPLGYALSGYVNCVPPQISGHPTSVTATQGQATSMQVSVNPASSGPITYQWYEYDEQTNSSSAIAGATSASLTLWPQATASYFVRVSNDCQYQDSNVATITVSGSCQEAVIKTLSAAGKTESSLSLSITTTSGTTISMAVTAAGTAPLTYQWYRVESGGDVLLGSSSSLSVGITTSKSYRVVVSNSCGSMSGTISVTVALSAPTMLNASKSGATQISLTWQSVPGASYYGLERKAAGADFTFVTWSSTPSYVDAGRQAATSYAYRVYAVDANYGSASARSNTDLGTTLTFTPVVPNMMIDDAHSQELLTAVNAARAVSGLPGLSWSQILANGIAAPAANSGIHGSHLEALRREMNLALQAFGAPTLPFTDPLLSGVPIKALHISELQQRGQ
jgi:YD repeat-containing protein